MSKEIEEKYVAIMKCFAEASKNMTTINSTLKNSCKTNEDTIKQYNKYKKNK